MSASLRGLLMLALGFSFVATSFSSASAELYRKRFDRQNAHGYVTAESWYGRGTISARVRPTRKGPQVQLPGGNWVYCAINCTHTLRIKTLDIWENMGSESDGVGYLRYDRGY